MTNLDDFDRSLGDFLAAGPVTAPEPPVIAALAHARTTPRRPDPFARFRSDAMARQRRAILGIRPGLVLAALTLVVASIGIAVIGSRPQVPSIVVGPTPSSPAATPLATMPAPFSTTFPLILAGGNPFTMTVTDDTGILFGAESGRPVGDGASVDGVRVGADPADPHSLLVTWVGKPCETRATLTVDRYQRTISIQSERCSGDTFPYDRVVRLRFGTDVRPGDWSASNGYGSEPTDPPVGGTPSQPAASAPADAIHVDLNVQGGGPTSIDVVDQSGLLVEAVSGRVGEIMSESMAATNDDAQTVRLTWPGSPCDTVHRLTIAVDLGLTIDRPECRGDAIAVYKSLILTFSRPVDAAAMDTALFDGRVGSGLPTWTATGGDSEGRRYVLDLFDLGAGATAIEAVDPTAITLGAGGEQLRVEQAGQSIIRAVWVGRPCATSARLTIDASGRSWVLAVPTCDVAGADVVRAVEVTFANPRSVETVSFSAGPNLP